MSRLDTVGSASDQWVHQLTDMSGRNRLLYYRHLKVGTLDLTGADPAALKRLLMGDPGTAVRLSKLFPAAADDAAGVESDVTGTGVESDITGTGVESAAVQPAGPPACPHRTKNAASGGVSADALKRARSIARSAVVNYEERGLRTLFIARGMATWSSERSRAVPAAPVLMCPAVLRRRGASERDYDISADGEWTLNEALLQALAQHFDVEASSESILGSYLEDARLDDGEAAAVFADLSERAGGVPGFAIDGQQLLAGNFMYRKMPMVAEMQQNQDALAGNDLIAAIAGDVQARESLRSKQAHRLDPAQPDVTPPADEYLVLDADSSQNAAVNAAVAGESFVLQGPPGTGKSQTIANLIATMTARGRSVLFVAEKRAAIDAVCKRLTAVGLDQFVLDLHGGVMSRRRTARHLDGTLTKIRRTPPADHAELHGKLVRARDELSDYADELHRKREPWGLSYFETQMRLHSLEARERESSGGNAHEPDVARPAERGIRPHGLARLAHLGREQANDVREWLSDWVDLAEPLLSGVSPWAEADIPTEQQVREVLDIVTKLESAIPAAQERVALLLSDLGSANPVGAQQNSSADALRPDSADALRPDSADALRPDSADALRPDSAETPRPGSTNPRDSGDLLGFLQDVEKTCSYFTEAVFELDLDALTSDLAPAKRGPVHRLTAQVTSSRYRAAKRLARSVCVSESDFEPETAQQMLEEARLQSGRWQSLGIAGLPRRLPGGLGEAVSAHRSLGEHLAALSRVLPGQAFEDRGYDDLAATVEKLASDQATLYRLPQVARLEQQLREADVGMMLDGVRSGLVAASASAVVDAFDLAWLQSIRNETLLAAPKLAAFDGQRQNRRVRDFRQHDADHLRRSPARVRRRIAEHAVAACDDHPDQSTLIRREAAKKTRHLPLRSLLEKAPDVLTAIQPCWAMSPLDVAHALPARQLFDLVVFDEASQIMPCDAVPALLRAPQAVVVGDSRQLPPTTFFDGSGSGNDVDSDDEDSDDGSLEVFESILDVLDALLKRRTISWHYRSQDERLIDYSNHSFYDGSLTTFPAVSSGRCPDFKLVRRQPDAPANTRSDPAEVLRVVDLMVKHARRRPRQSLGVITMGLYHANRIEEVLRHRIRTEDDPALEEFFDDNAAERAFVKNLERVQGDERDAVILSIGYGKDANGRLVYRFGPLNNEGGERRMNVAITRARQRMTLVSSFSHAEMDPDRLRAEGARHLHGYLRYAESGGIEHAHRREPLNPFEADVLDKLEAQGLDVAPQYGYSGFRIDFAVRHPSRPGRFVLAVEADGASYHSSYTARDRDRLRQEHLERLGWRFCRIWSTDWFNDHTHEVARVMHDYRQAVAAAGADTSRDAPGPARAQQSKARITETGKDAGERRTSEAVSQDAGSDGGASSDGDALLQRRGPPPVIAQGVPIKEHPEDSLTELALWVMSDGCLHTDKQIFEEMFQQMGYRRRGPRIKEALFKAIKRAKSEHRP